MTQVDEAYLIIQAKFIRYVNCEIREIDIISDLAEILRERNKYALLIFQPIGASHHDANKCPYCKENLSGKS